MKTLSRRWLFVGLLLCCLSFACGGFDENSPPAASPDDSALPAVAAVAPPAPSVSGHTSAPLYWPSDQRGPYAVGVTTIYLTDDERFEIWGMRDRELPLEIWYPSTGRGGHLNTLPDMVGEIPDWGMAAFQAIYGDSFDELWGVTTTAYRDAEVLPAGAPYPVIVFSHGLMAIRFQNFTLCEHLASHGFIVVAPDHYGNAIFTNLPPEDAVVIFNPVSTVTGVWDRPLDIEFVFARLSDLDWQVDSPFYLAMDLNRFAITGHSYGGLTSMLSGLVTDYLAAIAPLNPAWVAGLYKKFDKPFLLLQSDTDNIVGFTNEASRKAWDQSQSKHKVFLNLINAGHYSATDACLLLPESVVPPSVSGCDGSMIDPVEANRISAAYLTAFFRAVMMRDARSAEYLRENHFPGEVEVETIWQ